MHLWIATLMLSATQAAHGAEPVIYPVPKEILYSQHNDDYTVRVRAIGGAWRDLYEYDVMVDLDRPQHASMVMFDMDEPVELSVRKNNGTAAAVRIRPNVAGSITPRLVDNAAVFTIAHPAKLSVEFDGDKLHNLHVFANPPAPPPPDKNAPGVVWYGPGLHKPNSKPNMFTAQSNQTLYLAPGAVLQGGILVDHATNVRIIGRGIVERSSDHAFEIAFSSNVTIDGPTVINPKHYTVSCGQSDHVTITNLKTFSAEGWSDGIDMMSCSNVRIADVFLRTSDDSIAVYGHRWEYSGDVHDIEVNQAILWADVAHPINIGLHGDPAHGGESIERLRFHDIDVLEHDEDDPDYQGVMAITDGDANRVRDVIFDNIRVDDFEEGQLLNLRVVYNTTYNSAPGGGIRDIAFRNIRYTGRNDHASIVAGYDATRSISGVRFDNVEVNGRIVGSPADLNLAIGGFVNDVRFRVPSHAGAEVLP